ncbi:MAG: UTP--glucose-1-phosphate uridylyltransferase [Clostridia bacterium]|nr:UTP--glucose-1-phosphate uridylyltransferase [Clostridia bacterium]
MDYATAADLLKKHNQSHLLQYYGELSGEEREELLSHIARIDFSVLDNIVSGKREVGELSPADALSVSEVEARKDAFKRSGLNALKSGKVAAVLLAGGQGTRLGFNAPKGMFDIGVNVRLPIFACLINNLLQPVKEAGRYAHLFIMTSFLNDGQTRDFFAENGYFGYDPAKVHFYVQKTAPAISFDGKILLEEKYRPVITPNGNGGWYGSLVASDCGRILKEEGIEWLNVFGVDNVLQRICDPVFIGAALSSGLPCAAKVVGKSCAEEKVGVLCKEDGTPAIVEYFEMPEDKRGELAKDGGLKYRYGVTLNYLFNVNALDGASVNDLPYHLSSKKIACLSDGKRIEPAEPNGYKLETLAVDIVKLMGGCLGVEVEREREFAPVKNAVGVDSVETARQLLIKNGVKI